MYYKNTMTMNELAIVNERIDGVEERIKGVDNKVTLINKNVDLMVILLRGNTEFNKDDKGMIGDVSSLRSRVEKLEKFKDKMFWILITAAGITGLNLWQLLELVINAFKKH